MTKAEILTDTCRQEFAPEYDEETWPSVVQVQSKNNTTIESFWLWNRKGEGHNLKSVLLEGRDNGYFNGENPLHV